MALAADTVLVTHYNPLAYPSPFSVLYAWREGELTLLDHPNSSGSLAAAGRYAIWSDNFTLLRRDLQSGTNTVIAQTAGNWKNAVAPSGDVWFWGLDYQIYHYHEGTTTQLTNDEYQNTYTLSDGEHVVYRKRSATSYAIAMNGPDGEELLDLERVEEPSVHADYEIAGGFVAYTSVWGGAMQIFLRHPNGSKERLTQFGSDSRIDALSETGGVMLLNQGKRYYAMPGAAPQLVGPGLGEALSVASKWQFAIGRSVFGLLSEADDGGLVSEADGGGTDGGSIPAPDAGPPGEDFDADVVDGGIDDALDAGAAPPADDLMEESESDGDVEQETSPTTAEEETTHAAHEPGDRPAKRPSSDCAVTPGAKPASGWAAALVLLASALRVRRRRL